MISCEDDKELWASKGASVHRSCGVHAKIPITLCDSMA
jgi:hypothetical protein